MTNRTGVAAGRLIGFDDVADAWGALADRQGAPPSLHPGYVAAWLDAYATRDRFIAAAVFRDGQLVALAPAVRLGRGRWGTMPQTEQWGVVADDDTARRQAVHTLIGMLDGRLTLRPVPADEHTAQLVETECRALGAAHRSRIVDVHPLTEITVGWDEYWAQVPQQRALRRARRRLAESGEVTRETVVSQDDFGRVWPEVLRVEASGWKGRAGTALSQQERDRRFYEGIAAWATEAGVLRLELLRCDGELVAFAFDMASNGIRYSLKIGYDEAYARSSPGRILLAEQIESAFREGLARFDFCGTESDFKQVWANDERRYAEVVVTSPSLLGRAAAVGTAVTWGLRPHAKRLRNRLRRS